MSYSNRRKFLTRAAGGAGAVIAGDAVLEPLFGDQMDRGKFGGAVSTQPVPPSISRTVVSAVAVSA